MPCGMTSGRRHPVRNARAALLVGIVLILGALAFVATYSVSRKRFSTTDTYVVHAYLEDGSGLGPGTRITIAGVPVGEVIEVKIDSSRPDLARVDLAVSNDLMLFGGVKDATGGIADGAVIRKKASSLLGDQYLELTVGLRGEPLRGGDAIPTAISATGLQAIMKEFEKSGNLIARLDTIFVKLDAIAGDVQAVTGSVREVVGTKEGGQRLSRVAENVEQASSDVAAAVKEIRSFVADTRQFLEKSVLGRGDQVGRIIENVERFSDNAAKLSVDASGSAGRILDNVEVVTRDVRQLISGSRGQVETSLGSIRGALVSFTRTLQSMEGTISTINSIVSKIDSGEGSLGRLVNDSTLVDKTTSLVAKVDEVVTDAGDLVKKVTRLETKVELESNYLVEADAFKNYVRLRFQPREDKYYLLELVDDPGGKSSTEVKRTKVEGTGATTDSTEVVETTTDELKISLQFAKRWYFLTGRFGLMESSGGLGLDLEFLADALKFTIDLFDFDAEGAPRMRLLASYTFFEHFALTAGVDHTLEPDEFDWFFGIGLRFTDGDLKALLTVAPTPSL